MHGMPSPSPRQPSHRTLQKAHYTFMIDKDFMQQVREVKQSHERYVTAILASEVFPELGFKDPLQSIDEESVPTKFGPRWFEDDSKRNVDSDNIDFDSVVDVNPKNVNKNNRPSRQ